MESQQLPKPLFVEGRYQLPWTKWTKVNWKDKSKWLLTEKDYSKVPNEKELAIALPVIKPNFNMNTEDGIRVTWLGHSTLLIRMDSVTILTDPMFSNRASPTQILGTKRYRPCPCKIDELPNVDIVLISNSHYDHLDLNSVQQLNDKFGEQISWFVPLGLKCWMMEIGCENVYEKNWWEEHEYFDRLQIVSTPSQHWSKRGLNDENKTLWCSWCIIGSNRFFYAGDTGYPLQLALFRLIGEKFGPFDLSAIPIGGYEPRWVMQEQHISPQQAVEIHRDLKSRFSIGIHWGTFRLTNEHYLAPRDELEEALKMYKIPMDTFFTLNHGESRDIQKND